MKIIVTSTEELKKIIDDKLDIIVPILLERLSTTSKLDSQWLSVKQKASVENISVSMVYKLIAQGKYETRKVGRKTQVKA